VKLTRADLAALLLVGLVVLCITTLAVLHQAVPEILSTVALVALGIGGGVALPRDTSAGNSSTTADVVPPPAVVVPTQRATADAPVATHAPS
jgi:hypothetical protein